MRGARINRRCLAAVEGASVTRNLTRAFCWGLVLAVIALGVASPSWAAPPPPSQKDTLYLEANPSTGGSTPTTTGEGANLTYAYQATCGQTLSDTLKVRLKIENTDSTAGESFMVSFVANGDATIGSTLPSSTSLADNDTWAYFDIPFVAGPLVPGDYNLNIQINTNPGSSDITQLNPKQIKVQIHVDACETAAPTCFFTDSSGNFLTDCSGEPVSESDGGRFAIQNNKGKVIATNPGQFYYNYLWTNAGADVQVQILLGRSDNLSPQGANAVHAYTFDTSGFTQDVAAFDMVNQDGLPCGPSGPCTITVGQGETLWVTWHLEMLKGMPTPTAGDSCQVAAEEIWAWAKLVDPSDEETEIAPSCEASAKGYNKK